MLNIKQLQQDLAEATARREEAIAIANAQSGIINYIKEKIQEIEKAAAEQVAVDSPTGN